MQEPPSKEPAHVRRMFGAVARRYDLLNHLLSANMDRRWRRKAVEELAGTHRERVLDLCGGTGDLSLALARRGIAPLVVCCDFAPEMLDIAQRKFRRAGVETVCRTVEGDGLALPFADGAFDAVTVAFGVRNFHDMDRGLREIGRVLRPGGTLVVLEFSRPEGPLVSRLYRFYLRRVLPRFGDGVSGHTGPYRYLARTIADFPEPDILAGRIRDAGFAACGWKTLTGGIVAVHTAIR